MLNFLRNPKYQVFWFVFHAALGFACVQSKLPLIWWFWIVSGSFIINIFAKKEPQFNLICYLGYIMAFEVLGRGLEANPYIPHEIGKYATLVGFLVGIAMGGPVRKISIYGTAMLLLSLPALLLMPKYRVSDIVFNYLGPLTLFLGVIFCNRQIVTYTQFKALIRVIVYSIFSLACFTIFKASTFEKIEYGLSANFEASGGGISNQVATLFGTAVCFIVVMYLSGQRLFKYRWMDISLLVLFLIRGLLTFSRGGMVSAAIAILCAMFFPKAKAAWQDNQIKLRNVSMVSILFIFLVFVGVFYVVNNLTDNFLLWRYQGKTQQAIRTGFDNTVDLDQITSGRITILKSDINMFKAFPALGVGVGQSKYLREQYDGPRLAVSHLEFSRLLAEHGFLGAILVVMIFIYPFFRLLSEPNNYRRMINTIFLIMGLTATFHNAMRTMMTPLLFAFTYIHFVPDNYDWRSHLRSKRKFAGREVKTEAVPQPA